MGLSIHSLGMKEGARADASGGVEKGLTQEFILLVFGCSEGVMLLRDGLLWHFMEPEGQKEGKEERDGSV
ncbi:Protein SEY1 [Dissostichus eleginoides]|uniref:Protein SEY1 n=1 Tax=Dissostichus eleginoides TaxID=100907 RepID=A0AAD9F2T1_DISEL|nr:Protein SEY1 [Dissostichus eleginoides]